MRWCFWLVGWSPNFLAIRSPKKRSWKTWSASFQVVNCNGSRVMCEPAVFPLGWSCMFFFFSGMRNFCWDGLFQSPRFCWGCWGLHTVHLSIPPQKGTVQKPSRQLNQTQISKEDLGRSGGTSFSTEDGWRYHAMARWDSWLPELASLNFRKRHKVLGGIYGIEWRLIG